MQIVRQKDSSGGALYGKIGANGSPFFVGPNYTATVSTSGALFLTYGDLDYLNNTGSFSVHVTADSPASRNATARRATILNANR